jgi:hypothetical protein
MAGFEQVKSDLRFIFNTVPLNCLTHLRDNQNRLIRKKYSTADGGQGCIMFLLTETLPVEQRINSIQSLMQFFGCGGKTTLELETEPNYQPPKWIIRLWDGQVCASLRNRYGDYNHLSQETLVSVLDEAIAERQAIEQEAQEVEEQALARLCQIAA